MRTRRAVALVLPLALCAALVFALTAGSAAAERRAGTCTAADLVIWIPNGKGSGAAGSFYYNVELTNSSASSCTMKGYPKVTAVGLAGKRLGPSARREPTTPVKKIVLSPEASATFRVRITQAGDYSPSRCGPVNAGGLAIAPPETGTTKLVPLPFETCTTLGQPTLSATAVRGA